MREVVAVCLSAASMSIAMAGQDENQCLPLLHSPAPSPNKLQPDAVSQSSSSYHHTRQVPNQKDQPSPSPLPPKKLAASPAESIRAVASRIASQPLPCSDPDVWGVLTAISDKARKRIQGMNILLSADEHWIGRLMEDTRFQIDSSAVSQRHCQIFRRRVTTEDVEHSSSLYECVLKDSSTNGTFVNRERYKRGSSRPEAILNHGDIVSFAAPPHSELAFAFVFREVSKSLPSTGGGILKRKAEDFSPEGKRLKGLGIGARDGPISLDDFRSLQRSNTELRKQFEESVVTIDSMQKENRTVLERHEKEMKELKESISKSYIDQLKELNDLLGLKVKELEEVSKISAEQKHTMEDLNERLAASLQSCAEANEIVKSQKASIAEFKAQLDEERDQRREEREKAAVDLKAAVQKVHLESQEELKRISDANLRREREQQEVINKLQEQEKESSSLVENLRSKLEDTRQKLVVSDNKARQLETQVLEEQHASTSSKRRAGELELEVQRMRKELESEKAAKEEAWAKVSALEFEINAAMKSLDFERRRLRGARERIMLRETQLRSFYSTTEEINHLFAKQQEQLKAMQRTLEDEDNYQNDNIDVDPDQTTGIWGRREAGETDANGRRVNGTVNPDSPVSGQREPNGMGVETSSGSVTEKNEGEEDQNTQEADFHNEDYLVKGGFGSDIDAAGTAPMDGEAGGTEQLTETPNLDINKPDDLAGDTMQLEDDTHVQETEPVQMQGEASPCHSQSESAHEAQAKAFEDTPGGTIRTSDLLASEVAGSWACSTAPSVHDENESPQSRPQNMEPNTRAMQDSNTQVSESPSTSLTGAHRPVMTDQKGRDLQALSEMIGIVAPDLKEQFKHTQEIDGDEAQVSDSETNNSDEETQAGEDEDKEVSSPMEEDENETQEDSVG